MTIAGVLLRRLLITLLAGMMLHREMLRRRHLREFAARDRETVPWDLATCAAVLLVYFAATMWLAPLSPGADTEAILRTMMSGVPWRLMAQVTLWMPLVLGVAIGLCGGTLRDLGLLSQRPWRLELREAVRALLVLAGIFVGVAIAATLAMEQTGTTLPASDESDPTLVLLEQSSAGIFALLAVLLGPLGEELYFRGMLFPALTQRIGLFPAIPVCGVIFAAAHADQNLVGWVARSFLGGYLAFLYHRSGSLRLPILVHAGYNGGIYLIYQMLMAVST